jgi:tRNA dimethylallyltransferase
MVQDVGPLPWWAPVPEANKPDWEILPQAAKRPEVILSKRHELGILSNFAATPFMLRDPCLIPPREWLYARCDERFALMIERGAIDEVEALLKRDLDPKLPVMRAIGVCEISAYLSGEIDREQLIARGQQATRNYAKRQYTWFAHQPPPEWPRFTDPLDIGAALELLGASA